MFKLLSLDKTGCDLAAPTGSRCFNATSDGTRWYVEALVHGLRVRFLVDTGAELSVLNRRIYKLFSRKVDKSLIDVRPVQTATGSRLRAYGKMLISMTIQGHKLYAMPLVSDVTEDGILGMDWLRRFRSHARPCKRGFCM